ncbi:hypothetical protein DTL42_18320 [Bremerella cremea]|uniref:Uncharacterized protein n=1 Tax=Bremerella cremea TaxID=1031537 RepID=A0A368KML6_9BACT|nr:hypothetical protein [Bremerella cremea]RCS43942.1 hypothetical protein DTL42_18320 [Bremerella cremea]
MPWPYRHIILVAAADREAANAIAASIDPDDGSGTFGIPLSPTAAEPATHYGCSTASEFAMAEAMFEAQPVLSSVKWWRLEAASGQLIDSNTLHGLPGQRWTWSDALQAANLLPIVGEEP